MILTFSRRDFMQKIISGTKRTTIREDKARRWKAGRYIQFWMHNPRNVSKNPHCFAIGRAKQVEEIQINTELNTISLSTTLYTTKDELDKIAQLDGFADWEDMKTFFKGTFNGVRITFEIHTIFL